MWHKEYLEKEAFEGGDENKHSEYSQKQRSNTLGNHYLSTIAEGLKQTYQFDEKMAFQYLEDHC